MGAFLHFYGRFKEDGLEYNFWYFLWSIVFYLGLTIFSVPMCMGYEMVTIFMSGQYYGNRAMDWAVGWVMLPVLDYMYDPEWFPSPDVAARQLAIWVAILVPFLPLFRQYLFAADRR